MNQNSSFNNNFNNNLNNMSSNLNQVPIDNMNVISKFKLKIWMIVISVLVVVVGVGAFFGIKYLFGDTKDKEQKALSQEIAETPIIVENSKGMKALYNSNGEKLTEFSYEKINEFLNDVSLVEKPDYVYEILDNKGNVVVASDKYNRIEREGYLFEVRDKKYDRYLLNTKGEVIYNLEEIDAYVKTYDSKKIVAVENDEFYDFLGVSGKSILKLDKLNKDNKAKVYIEGVDYATVFHNNTSYMINLDKEAVVNKVNSTSLYYVASYDDNNTDKYIMTVDVDGLSMKEFKLMNKEQVIYTKECSNMFFSSNGSVICAKGYNGRYYLDDKGNDGVEYYLSDNVNIDYDTYISFKNGKKGTFYKDGKMMTTVDCVNSYSSVNFSPVADSEEEIFSLFGVCNENKGKYYYYYSNGEKFVDKEFISISNFDENGLAKVGEVEGKYYLMNNKGEKITSDYDFISFNSSNYVYFKFHNSIYFAKLGDEYRVINTKGEEIFKTKGTINIYFNYFTVEENGDFVYYTLEGNEFYKR